MKSHYPTFLYIGAEKAGSTWIWEILREHPDVFVTPAKDLMFFYSQQYRERGFNWYLNNFEGEEDKIARGEVDHDLFMHDECAQRIQNHLPEIKLIACLREPISRTLSSYIYYKLTKLNEETSFEDYIKLPRTLKLSDYYHNLKPFYNHFPAENILVLYYDELVNDASAFAERIFDFLGADPSFVPKVLNKKLIPASKARFTWLAHLSYRFGLIMRKLSAPNVVGAVKTSGVFNRLLYKPLDKKPEIALETRQKLWAYYQERYEGLPELIGRPLPEKWLEEPV
jgi:hypothetical protein